MLMAQRSAESTRAYQESWETRFLATANAGQVDGNANLVNGFAHRIASAETDNVFAISQLIAMKLAFNKANVPDAGRVFICDSIVEATLSNLITITTDITPFGVDILKNGLGRGMRMSMSLHGFDIIFSNRLPTGTFSDGTTQVTNAVANIAMCILDDQCKPVMGVHRRFPKVEGERNKDLSRDEFVSKARYGLGVQRTDTLGVIITSAVNY